MGFNKKIVVCHLISGDLWAGAEVQVYTLIESLKKYQDLDLMAIVLNKGVLSEKLDAMGIDVTVIDESKYSFIRIAKQMLLTLEKRNVDILHTHRYKENILGSIAKRRHVAKHLVQTVHGLQEKYHGIRFLKMRLYNWLNRYVSRKYFSKILAVSTDIHRQLLSVYGASRLVTVHNAININEIKVTQSKQNVKGGLNIEQDRLVIGCAGRMVPIKGYEILLSASSNIIRGDNSVCFVFTGDGPLKYQLENMANELQVSSHVRFTGFRSDIINILNCMDIFVIPSYYEGIPMVLLETMALGKAIVASEVGGIKEVIEHGSSGLLIEPGDPQALSKACNTLLKDSNLRKKLAEGAIKRVNNLFSTDTLEEKMRELYLGLP